MKTKPWMSVFFVALVLFFSANAQATPIIGEPVSHALISPNSFSNASVDNSTTDALNTLTRISGHTLLAQEDRHGRRGSEDGRHTTGYVDGMHQDHTGDTIDHRRRDNEDGQHTTGYVGGMRSNDHSGEPPESSRRPNHDDDQPTGYVGGMHGDDNEEEQGNAQADSEDHRRERTDSND